MRVSSSISARSWGRPAVFLAVMRSFLLRKRMSTSSLLALTRFSQHSWKLSPGIEVKKSIMLGGMPMAYCRPSLEKSSSVTSMRGMPNLLKTQPTFFAFSGEGFN